MLFRFFGLSPQGSDFTLGEDVTSLDSLSEDLRPLYADNGAGAFSVPDSMKPVVNAINGMKKALTKAREEAKSNKPPDLSPLSDFGSTIDEISTTVKTKIDELTAQAAGKGKDSEKVIENLKRDMTTAHEKEKTALGTRIEGLTKQLHGLLVGNEATQAIVAENGDPELLMPFVTSRIKVSEEDGEFRVYVVDADGEKSFGATGQDKTIRELVKEMKAQEKYQPLFKSDSKGGGGARPNPKNGQQPQSRQLPREDKSATQKIADGLSNRNRVGAR